MKRLRFTKSEEELLEVFWNAGKPLTSVEITEITKEKTWSIQYVLKLLKSLEKQKIISVCGTVKCGNQYARQFEMLLTKEEVAARSLISQGFNKKDIANIAVALIKETDESETEVPNEVVIEKLEKMLEEFKANSNKK